MAIKRIPSSYGNSGNTFFYRGGNLNHTEDAWSNIEMYSGVFCIEHIDTAIESTSAYVDSATVAIHDNWASGEWLYIPYVVIDNFDAPYGLATYVTNVTKTQCKVYVINENKDSELIGEGAQVHLLVMGIHSVS